MIEILATQAARCVRDGRGVDTSIQRDSRYCLALPIRIATPRPVFIPVGHARCVADSLQPWIAAAVLIRTAQAGVIPSVSGREVITCAVCLFNEKRVGTVPTLNIYPREGVLRMLVLSRERGQSIVVVGIGTIHVRQCKGGRVRLAFDFPPDVVIARSEVARTEQPKT